MYPFNENDHFAWVCDGTPTPPLPRPTLAELVQAEADQALYALNAYAFGVLADDMPEYAALCQAAFEALSSDPARAKALGKEVQAATEALRDMARDDVRALIVIARRAVCEALGMAATQRQPHSLVHRNGHRSIRLALQDMSK
jgi:hypothetical protein